MVWYGHNPQRKRAAGSVLGEKSQTGAFPLPATRCASPDVQLLCAVIGPDCVMVSDNRTDNDSGAHQCQQIRSLAECMIAITALVVPRSTVLHPMTFAYRDNNSQSVSIFLIVLFPTCCPPLPPRTPHSLLSCLPNEMGWWTPPLHERYQGSG